ncbi:MULTISPECIES: peptidylprolyl isomerase [unclassified Neisseria]|uniref:peptidylprolyl isomerase n=1 Tax=unclassified Neisseria TaxID=2623750 RepID=UPI0010720648|nr:MULTISPECIES: peptidylprolyl isomerase [unclassified Neisseria]MBF0804115.1 peptidylprolyl isomerase [Neisseria sp. 19428wB4_WF04]TFU43133.1 peptidylprolyl isomerase [Neisseria sp. WF04]
MNFKPLMLAAALGFALQTAPAAEIKQVDGIAAVVGNEVITQRDVRQGMAEARSRLGKNVNEAELRTQVLQQLINQSLIVQAGKRRNITAGNAEIDAALSDIAQSRRTTIEGLYAQAAQRGVSKAAVRRSVADSIITQKVRQQAVMQQSRVSDAEIDSMIAHAKQQGAALPQGEPPRQYRAQHILLKAENANAAKAAESGIRKIYNQARSGNDFAALARQYSQDGSAAGGGDLGWFSDGQMVPEFENAVHSLKPGQISRPVRSQFGWHIIKLNDVREAGTPEERQREAVRQYIARQKAEQATANLLKELHENAYVEIRR